jgi:endonuclease YncB( thermonuclease family)
MVRASLAVLTLAVAGIASAGERCGALDGNTLLCGEERVLVDGLRQPLLHEPGGEAARQRLHRHVQSGELILRRKSQRDRFGRTLARAYLNGNRITDLDVSMPSGHSPRRR